MKMHKIYKNCRNNLKGIYGPLMISAIATFSSANAKADTYFNPAFLSNDPNAVADLAHFAKNNGQAPGKYRVDVYLNGNFVLSRDVEFKYLNSAQKKSSITENSTTSQQNDIDKSGLKPCLTISDLNEFGVNTNAISNLSKVDKKSCIDIESAIPDSSASLDFEKLKLDISVPQVALHNSARGYISPEYWDNGINALLLNYNFSGSQSKTDGNNSTNEFVSLQSGINLGPWRLRDNSTWNYSQSNNETINEWQHISTYIQRPIIPLKANFTAGDTSTPSDVFDSLPIRGVLLASDDNMLPDSLRGFAPTVRGIAKSNAKVTIKQNGYTIYQTYVSPGAFAISDLFPTSSSGDLNVSIEETDGSVNSYTIPYSAVPILQREGRVKYALSAAEYHSGSDNKDNPDFLQGTLIWGLSKGYTIYGGTQLSQDYSNFAIGVGKNLGMIGAISVDISRAESTLADDSEHKGESLRFLYAKALNEWGTNFQLLGYRYSTEGYYSFDEVTYKQMDGFNSTKKTYDNEGNLLPPNYSDYYNLYFTKKGKIQANISQQVSRFGSIFLSGSQQSYWHTDELNSMAQMGYNGMAWDIQYSIAYSYNKSPGQPSADQMVSINLSLPISKWLYPNSNDNNIGTTNSAYATYNSNSDQHGNVNQQAGVSGTLLKDNNLSYSIMQGYGNNGVGNSGSANASYQGTYGNVNAGYNYSKDYQQVNYGASGGMVLHKNGITLSQPLGDTNVLVAAPDADDVSVENYSGVRTDWRGYAVVPYASTYRQNRIALDPTTLDAHTDLDNAVVNVVPTQGALVRADFKTHVGVKALLTIVQGGKPLPFGATVSLINEQSSTGIVGDDGQVYLSGLPLSGTLFAKWGNAESQQCRLSYSLPKNSMGKSIVYDKETCQ